MREQTSHRSKSNVENMTDESNSDMAFEERPTVEGKPTWVDHCTEEAPGLKKALGRYIATHFVKYADGILLGPGTTSSCFTDQLIIYLTENSFAWDLKISSTSQDVSKKWRFARAKEPGLFGNTQINQIGGELLDALDCLVGQYAVDMINNDLFFPEMIIHGCATINLVGGGFRMGFQFQPELSVQYALATRPTSHRILAFDHSKFKPGGWNADISIKKLMSNTPLFTIISTYPQDADQRELVNEQFAGFKAILEGIVNSEIHGDASTSKSELKLILINEDGDAVRDLSLSALRKKRRKDSQIEKTPGAAPFTPRNGSKYGGGRV